MAKSPTFSPAAPAKDTAATFHCARNQAFDTWAEITGLAMAA
jgi:hypothetical protein